jgi:hypothetical protein
MFRARLAVAGAAPETPLRWEKGSTVMLERPMPERLAAAP